MANATGLAAMGQEAREKREGPRERAFLQDRCHRRVSPPRLLFPSNYLARCGRVVVRTRNLFPQAAKSSRGGNRGDYVELVVAFAQRVPGAPHRLFGSRSQGDAQQPAQVL